MKPCMKCNNSYMLQILCDLVAIIITVARVAELQLHASHSLSIAHIALSVWQHVF